MAAEDVFKAIDAAVSGPGLAAERPSRIPRVASDIRTPIGAEPFQFHLMQDSIVQPPARVNVGFQRAVVSQGGGPKREGLAGVAAHFGGFTGRTHGSDDWRTLHPSTGRLGDPARLFLPDGPDSNPAGAFDQTHAKFPAVFFDALRATLEHQRDLRSGEQRGVQQQKSPLAS